MDTQAAYLDLLKRTLTRYGMAEVERRPLSAQGWKRRPVRALQRLLRRRGLELVRPHKVDLRKRREGRDWPLNADTMIGLQRLDNLQQCIEAVLDNEVPGDILEAGVWRGGAAVFARAVLAVHGVTDRTVWLADSFQGLPPPVLEQDAGDDHHLLSDYLGVGVDQVRATLSRYGMLDEQIGFLVGWFADTLPSAPVEQLAVLRLDGDMYGSTMDTLQPLYPKVASGGFVIVDDYHVVDGSRRAVTDYRAENEITDPIQEIDGSAVFWQVS